MNECRVLIERGLRHSSVLCCSAQGELANNMSEHDSQQGHRLLAFAEQGDQQQV